MNEFKYTRLGPHKYRLDEDYEIQTAWGIGRWLELPFISLNATGLLRLRKGYITDACSGPTRDTEHNIRAGFIHDAGYALIRNGLLSMKFKPIVDYTFYLILIEDKEKWAFIFYLGVKYFGKLALHRRAIRFIINKIKRKEN